MGMHSEIHWQGDRNSWECILRFIGREIGTRTKASRVGMELKLASHYRTFRGMECPQTLALMQKFSIQGLSKKAFI